jgi:hypothetical protein
MIPMSHSAVTVFPVDPTSGVCSTSTRAPSFSVDTERSSGDEMTTRNIDSGLGGDTEGPNPLPVSWTSN